VFKEHYILNFMQKWFCGISVVPCGEPKGHNDRRMDGQSWQI